MLLGRGKRKSEGKEKEGSKTHLPQHVVDVAVVLRKALRELVVLLREAPDVDTAQRVRLREGEGEGEAGTVRRRTPSSAPVRRHVREKERGGATTYPRSSSALHSPSLGSQETETTFSNSSTSLTTIGWWSSSSTICIARIRTDYQSPHS